MLLRWTYLLFGHPWLDSLGLSDLLNAWFISMLNLWHLRLRCLNRSTFLILHQNKLLLRFKMGLIPLPLLLLLLIDGLLLKLLFIPNVHLEFPFLPHF